LPTVTVRAATTSPTRTVPKSMTVGATCATAGAYTRPLRATLAPGRLKSGAPLVVPALLETSATPTAPLKLPAVPVGRLMPRLPLALGASTRAAPALVPAGLLAMLAFSRSVKRSGALLLTPMLPCSVASPTRPTSVSGVVSTSGTARR
jgi:hypothetical protein